jgi:gas vesicle protein
MLIAPEKGVDLQKRIRDGAQDWLDEISRLVNSRRKLVTDGVQPEAAQSEHQRAVHGLTNN